MKYDVLRSKSFEMQTLLREKGTRISNASLISKYIAIFNFNSNHENLILMLSAYMRGDSYQDLVSIPISSSEQVTSLPYSMLSSKTKE
jgi:hypothetical protein